MLKLLGDGWLLGTRYVHLACGPLVFFFSREVRLLDCSSERLRCTT